MIPNPLFSEALKRDFADMIGHYKQRDRGVYHGHINAWSAKGGGSFTVKVSVSNESRV